METPIQPRRMFLGEKSFALFFVIWGTLLQLNCFISLAPNSVFFKNLESYAAGWIWGIAMIVIGVGRFIAYYRHSPTWRIRLSSATIILLWLVAGVAFWSRLIAATFPLAIFVAILAQQFHRRLARDVELGF